MSREIKFRAVLAKVVYTVNFIDFENGAVDFDDDGIATTTSITNATLLQFTGLTDKNGVEIYEGDIVRYETNYYGKHRVNKTTVEWDDDIENDSFGCPYTAGYVIHGNNWEVIGNIYMNPELLNDQAMKDSD